MFWWIIIATFTVTVLPGALGGEKTSDSWREAALARHNEHRKKHNAAPLKMGDAKMCDFSQTYANELAEEIHTLKHSEHPDYGENLYRKSQSPPVDYKDCDPNDAVDRWYEEIKDYKGDYSSAVGHFTQLVWKGTTSVCVSYQRRVANGYSEFYVVANYHPPGNVMGKFKENVDAEVSPTSSSPDKGRLGLLGFLLLGVLQSVFVLTTAYSA